MSWISTVLPTIGHLLGGPMGGMAVEVVGKCLGIDSATTDKVTKALAAGNLTAEQMAALQAADLQLKTRMAELGLDAEKLAQADRASAREMQVKTGSHTVPILASAVTVGFFGILVGLMTGDLKMWEGHAELQMLVGSLASAWAMIVSFYFGASHVQPGDKK